MASKKSQKSSARFASLAEESRALSAETTQMQQSLLSLQMMMQREKDKRQRQRGPSDEIWRSATKEHPLRSSISKAGGGGGETTLHPSKKSNPNLFEPSMGLSTQTTATTCTAASTDTNTISRGTPPAFMEVGDDEEPPRRGRRRVPTPISRHRTDKGPGGQRGVTVQVDSPDRAHDLTADSHSANGGLTSSNVQTDFFTVTPPVQPPKGSAEGRGRARHRDRFGRGIETISHQKKERQNTLTASQLRKANKPNEEGGMLESLLNDQNLPVLAPDNSSSNQRQNSRFPPLRGQPTKTGSKLAGHTGNEAKDLGEKKKDKPSMKVTPGPAHHFQKHQERRLRQGISLPPNRHPNSRLPSQLPSLEDLKARAIARAALSKGRGRGGRHRESGSVHDGTLTHEPQSMAAPSHPPHTPTGFTRFPTRLHTQNTHSSSAVSPPTPVLSSEMETGKGGRIGKGEEKERERGRNDLTDLLSPIPSSSNFSPIPPGPKQEKERERTTTNSAAHSADPHYLALQKEKGNCGELKREHEPKEKTSVKTVRFVDVSIAKEGANVAGRGKEEEIRAKKGIKKEEAGPGKVTFSATSMVGSSDAVSPGVPLSPLSPSLERKKSDYPDGEAKVGGQTQKEEGKQAGDTREDGRPAFADAGSLSPVGGMEREREKGAGGLSRAFARAGARLTSALVLSEDEENTTERAEGGAQTDTVGDSGKDKSSHDEMPSTKAKPQPNRGGRRLLAGGETGNEGRIPEKSQPENERVPSSCLSRQRQQRRGKGGQGQGREKEKEKDNGSLWGEFDEEGEHQQFLKALEEWRAGRKQAAGADSSSQVAKGTEMTEEGEDETSSSAMQPLGDWTEKVLFSSDQNEMEEGTIMGENSAAEAAQKGKVSASPEILSQLCQRGSHVLPSSSSSNNLSASQTLGKNKKEKGNTNNPTQFVRGGPPPGWSLRPSASLSSNSDPHASTSQTEDTSPKNEGQILSSLVVQSSLRARPDAEVCVGHLKHGKHGVPSYTGKTAAGSRKAKTRPTPRGTCVSVPPKHEKKPPSRASKKEMEIQTEGMGTQTEGGLEEGKERERECFDQQPAVPPSCPTAPECEEVRFPLSPSGVAALHTTEWRRWTVGPDGQHRQTITASSVDIEAVCSASCAALQGKGGGKGEGGGSLGDSGKEFGDSKFQQQSFEGGGYIQKKRESAGRGLESVNEPKGGQEKKVEAHSEKETTGAEAMQDAGLKFWALTGTESIRVRTPVEGVKRRPAPPPSPAGGTGNGTAAQGKPVSLSPLWSADLNNVEGGQGGGIKSFRTHQQIPSWKTKTRDAETSAGEEDGEAMEKTQGPERRGRVLRSRGLRINTDIPDLDTETETGTGESCAVAEEEKVSCYQCYKVLLKEQATEVRVPSGSGEGNEEGGLGSSSSSEHVEASSVRRFLCSNECVETMTKEVRTRRLRLEQFAIDRETLALQAEAEETAAKTRQRKREIEMGRKMEEERRDGDVESDSMGEQSDRLLSSSSSSAIMASFQALAESLSAVRQKEGLGGFLVEPKGPEKEGKRESEGMEGKTKGQSQTEFERESQGEKDSLSLGNMALFFQAVGKGRA